MDILYPMKQRILLFIAATIGCFNGYAQGYKDGKLYLNENGSHYLKFTFLNQTWLRFNQSNPGSTVYGFDKTSTTDIGLRRTRVQFYGQLTDRVFIYGQVGENNFNYLADRKFGFFLHDVVSEYAFIKDKLSVGGGLTGWSGLARFASPAAGSIMGVDAPLFEQATNDVTDQFLRKLSIYAKGKLGRIDYRFAVSDPMAIQKATTFNAATALGTNANFSLKPAHKQWQGYVQYQFKDKEANTVPYTTGTYLGSKRVLNLGVGFIHQAQAMWRLSGPDTLTSPMTLLATDFFYDAPLDTHKGTALSVYAVVGNYNFGKNYLRNLGVMNPANGNRLSKVMNGAGNAFPMFGTGRVAYAQVGYKLKNNLLGTWGTLMPYVAWQHANYERLADPVNFWDTGINWLINGHAGKITLAYQNRPIFDINTQNEAHLNERKGGFIVQYQAFFN